MKIAFFGLPLAAYLLHRDGHDIVFASLCRPSCPGERRVRRALGDDRVAIKPDPSNKSFLASLRSKKPDIVISWFWTNRLPPSVLSLAPLGAFGVHPSLLPRHRGPDPYFWAIDSGDAETGVTAHRLDEAYDTGAILGQSRIEIDSSWNSWTLAKRLDRPSLALLRNIANDFANGHPPSEVAQDERWATDAPTPTDDILEIDWSRSSAEVLRRIRAASPAPGAFTFFGETPVTILRAIQALSFPRSLSPGEACVVDDSAVIRTGDGAVTIVEGSIDYGEDHESPHSLTSRAIARLVASLRQVDS